MSNADHNAWLDAHLKKLEIALKCPVCAAQDWVSVDDVGALPAQAAGGLALTLIPKHIPLVVAVCRRCFYVMLFSRNLLEQSQAKGST